MRLLRTPAFAEHLLGSTLPEGVREAGRDIADPSNRSRHGRSALGPMNHTRGALIRPTAPDHFVRRSSDRPHLRRRASSAVIWPDPPASYAAAKRQMSAPDAMMRNLPFKRPLPDGWAQVPGYDSGRHLGR
jgi:hypothetical protein